MMTQETGKQIKFHMVTIESLVPEKCALAVCRSSPSLVFYMMPIVKGFKNPAYTVSNPLHEVYHGGLPY